MATPLAGTAALADAPRVLTDTPVVQSLVAQVLGSTPEVLLDRGGDPHSFQLRPSQARALSQADLLFWIGPELTPWLERAIDGTGVSGEVVTLLQVAGLDLAEFADGHGHGHGDHDHDDHGHDRDDHGHDHDDHGHDHDDHGHDHDDHGHDHDDHGHDHDDHGHDHDDHGHDHDDHGHDHDDHGHDHDDHGHDHSHDGLDPHAWLSTHNAAVWLEAIATELAEHDPAGAETYAANVTTAVAALSELEAEVRAILEPVGDAPIVTFHDAYGYFARAFGLNVAATITLGDAAAPGAARLTEVRALLADEGAVCVFPEVNHSPAYVDVVLEGTDVRLGALLDPAGVMLEPGPDLYATLLRTLAQDIADCVTGS